MSSTPPERRRPTLTQRVSLGADFAMIASMATLVYWVGQQSKTIETTKDVVTALTAKQGAVDEKVGTISGQMLQMTSNASMFEVSQRVAVLETQARLNEQTSTVFRDDLKTRLTRIETKIDRDQPR